MLPEKYASSLVKTQNTLLIHNKVIAFQEKVGIVLFEKPQLIEPEFCAGSAFIRMLFILSQKSPEIERHFSSASPWRTKVQPAAKHFRSGERTPCVLASCGQDAQDPPESSCPLSGRPRSIRWRHGCRHTDLHATP